MKLSRRPTPRRFRPAVSPLEGRLLLAAYAWDVSTGGDFDNPLNWVDQNGNHGIPGQADSASIGPSGITVTVSQNNEVNSINSGAGSLLAIDSGTFKVENIAASSTINSLYLAPGATLEADRGVTYINGTDTFAGTFDAAVGASISFGYIENQGVQQLDAGAAFAGGGVFYLSVSWAVNAPVTAAASANFELDTHGDLAIATGDTFTVLGSFVWTGGALDGSGTTIIGPNGTLDLTTANNKDLQGNTTLTNQGAVTWDGTGQIAGSGTFNNDGTFTTAQNDTTSGSFVFNNYGKVTKTIGGGVGVGITTFGNYLFNNFGTVDCLDGTIDLNTYDNANKGSEDSGTFDASTAATIEFTNGYATLNAGTVLGGAGFFNIDNATVEIDNAVSVKNLGLGDGGTIDGDATLTVTVFFDWDGGAFDGRGATLISAGASFEIDPVAGTDNDTIEGGYTLTNAGAATWQGSGNITGNSYSGTIINSGTLVIENGTTMQNVVFDNSGTITKQGSVNTTSFTPGVLTNTGVMNVDTGTIYANSSPELAGRFNVAANATLSFTEGTVTGIITAAAGSTVILNGYESITAIVPTPLYINPGAALNGPGVYDIAAVYFNTNATIQDLNLANWSLDGPANVTVTGALNWTGGDLADTNGTLTIPVGATLDISGNNSVSFGGRTVNLAGQAIWTGIGTINLNGSPLNILPTGVFKIENDQPISGGGVINNLGTITKLPNTATGAGLGTTTIGISLSNYGVVAADSGTLTFTSGIAQVSGSQLTGGSWSVASGSTTPVVLNLGPAITAIGSGASVTLSGAGASFADLSGLTSIAGSLSLFAGQDFTAPGNLTISGTINLGALGVLTVTGNYTQTTTGSIGDCLGSGANGQVAVGGTATLAGTFTALVGSAFQPPIEAAFKVLTFAKRAGSFGAINGLTLAGGEILSPAYNATNFTLTAVPINVATNVTAQVTLTLGAFQVDQTTGIETQAVVLKNTGTSTITGPISLVLDHLTNASLLNQSGTTLATAPAGSPYVNLALGASGTLAVGQSASVLLVFYDPSLLKITDTPRILAGLGAR